MQLVLMLVVLMTTKKNTAMVVDLLGQLMSVQIFWSKMDHQLVIYGYVKLLVPETHQLIVIWH